MLGIQTKGAFCSKLNCLPGATLIICSVCLSTEKTWLKVSCPLKSLWKSRIDKGLYGRFWNQFSVHCRIVGINSMIWAASSESVEYVCTKKWAEICRHHHEKGQKDSMIFQLWCNKSPLVHRLGMKFLVLNDTTRCGQCVCIKKRAWYKVVQARKYGYMSTVTRSWWWTMRLEQLLW